MKKVIAWALVACLHPGAARAQAKPGAEVWAQEPAAVFGIKLGEQLDTGLVPNCPTRDYSRGVPPMPTSLCLDRGTMAILGTPNLGFYQWTQVTLLGDRVMQILLNFENKDFDQVKAMLAERYGPPKSEATSDWQAASGAKFPSRTLTWSGKKTVIALVERNARVDFGQVSFLDIATYMEVRRMEADSAKKAAGAL